MEMRVYTFNANALSRSNLNTKYACLFLIPVGSTWPKTSNTTRSQYQRIQMPYNRRIFKRSIIYITLHCIVSHYVTLRYAMLRYVILHCITLHYVTLRCTTLRYYAALRCAALRCAALRCAALRCAALRCAALRCAALRCAALHCTALHCTALHCTALLHYITLHYITLQILCCPKVGISSVRQMEPSLHDVVICSVIKCRTRRRCLCLNRCPRWRPRWCRDVVCTISRRQ